MCQESAGEESSCSLDDKEFNPTEPLQNLNLKPCSVDKTKTQSLTGMNKFAAIRPITINQTNIYNNNEQQMSDLERQTKQTPGLGQVNDKIDVIVLKEH